MRAKQTPAENSSPQITLSAAWRVAEVEPLEHYKLWVRFLDGTAGDIDLTPLIFGPQAGGFAALKECTLFTQAYVHYGAVTWPGEIDLAPDKLYRCIKKSYPIDYDEFKDK